MRSIRRSLLLYFLALMAVALGAVGLLIDELAERTLAVQTAKHSYIDQRYTELIHEERENLTWIWLTWRLRIAYDVWMQSPKDTDRHRQFMRYTQLGTLAVGMSQYSWPGLPIWMTMPFNSRVNEVVAKPDFSRLHLPDEPSPGLVVMATVQGTPDKIYRSRRVEGENWDPTAPHLEPNKYSEERVEDRFLKDGSAVRTFCLQIIQGGRFPRFRPSFNPPPGRVSVLRDLNRVPGRILCPTRLNPLPARFTFNAEGSWPRSRRKLRWKRFATMKR